MGQLNTHFFKYYTVKWHLRKIYVLIPNHPSIMQYMSCRQQVVLLWSINMPLFMRPLSLAAWAVTHAHPTC